MTVVPFSPGPDYGEEIRVGHPVNQNNAIELHEVGSEVRYMEVMDVFSSALPLSLRGLILRASEAATE